MPVKRPKRAMLNRFAIVKFGDQKIPGQILDKTDVVLSKNDSGTGHPKWFTVTAYLFVDKEGIVYHPLPKHIYQVINEDVYKDLIK